MHTNELRELEDLVELGPRFHGTAGNTAANEFLRDRLEELGLEVRGSEVVTRGWQPGAVSELSVVAPERRAVSCWPMLWSGPSTGKLTGSVVPVGHQGLWSDAMVWRKLAVMAGEELVAFLHARDVGPAAPQPLPAGSDESVAHVAIGRVDGEQLAEWVRDGRRVEVELEVDAGSTETAVSENLSVVLPGPRAAGRVVVCGHFDTFWNTPGAYDNGSGTVALLSLARHWSRTEPEREVEIVFFTAEEWHLAGSRSYVASRTEQDLASVDLVLNIDGLGRGDHLEVSVGPESLEHPLLASIRCYADSTGRPLELTSRFPPLVGTDHAPFHAAGVPAAHLTFNDLHRLHQPTDLPNQGIAANIAWTVPLMQRLVADLEPPSRPPVAGLL
jgi:Peptidase family M28